MLEQTKLSQKLANEKAEDQEKRIQEMVSQERNRLARELHDSVSQQLFAASMMMSAITESRALSDDRETKQLKLIEETIHQSQLEMRALLLHLRPAALKGKSLQEGVQELLMELMQKVTMSIKWKVEPIPLDKGVEDHLFRILQESVSNTLRHAKATSLDVLLIKRDDFVIMRVSDDGVGFEVDEGKTGSYGLQNMHERAVEIGGTLKIVSLKNKGTRLEVKVPVLVVEGDEK
jgi:NarL family two-component system sensor histidine kinase LiaS